MKKFIARAYIWLLLILLYAPIVIIAIFSFTEAKVLGNWTGFSLKLYGNLLSGGVSSSLVKAIGNTLSIGVIAAVLSTLLGSIAAIGIFNMKGRMRKAITFLNDVPMLNPDIITGVSLFILFVAMVLASQVKYIWKTKLEKQFASSLDVLDEMRAIRCIEHKGRKSSITPFVGAQLDICEAFGFEVLEGCAPKYRSKKVEPKRRGRPRKPRTEALEH